MRELTEGLLTIAIEEKDNEVCLKLEGDSRDIEPAVFLDPYFKEIVEEMKSKGKKLVVDFRNLNSMNSSTVLPIITFVRNLEEGSISTEIVFDLESNWQKASFIPLSAITKFYKFVKVIR
ncbi:MAG: hypothetical protein JXB88_13270 [Spirochaetales bacterium]|nr:hypothetical protein [Spirochaetales bacterium]